MSTVTTVTPVQVIVFHKGADRHVDDAACLWIARTRPEAEVRFPGIGTAEVIFDGTGGETYEGKSGDELETEGILMFGVGGGRFDEHPGPKNVAKKECSFALFCHEIGIATDPALADIIRYVAESDRGNSGHSMSLGSLAKVMHRKWPDNPEKVFEWQSDALAAKYADNQAFRKTEDEYEEKAVKKWVNKVLVVSIETDNELIKDVARSNGAGVVIQRRPLNAKVLPGNVMIYTDRRARVSLAEVVVAIRQEEQRARGSVTVTDPHKLRAPGKIEGVLNWYFLTGGASDMLLNGSFSAPNTPPTALSLKTIQEIVYCNI
jgi:hypothetical protein